MMLLKLFRTRERDLIFIEKDWISNELQKNYTLTLDLGRLKIRSATRFILFVLQGNRYVHLSEGSEIIVDSGVRYVSHFPFAGKVKIR